MYTFTNCFTKLLVIFDTIIIIFHMFSVKFDISCLNTNAPVSVLNILNDNIFVQFNVWASC